MALLMDLMATYLGAFLHAILKFVQRIYYGKGELERLLTDSSKHTIDNRYGRQADFKKQSAIPWRRCRHHDATASISCRESDYADN